ncbi:MAG: hypothetical protein JXR76_26945 [Deltaproteobacteria bacterium]|nr:hypothetical protein [Deltaproteobacteria bacterium]
MKIFYIFLSFFLYHSPLKAEDGYVAVDPASLNMVDGQTLMIIAYSIINGMLFLYWGYMTYQSRRLMAQLVDLHRETSNLE